VITCGIQKRPDETNDKCQPKSEKNDKEPAETIKTDVTERKLDIFLKGEHLTKTKLVYVVDVTWFTKYKSISPT
jgi:hypothetical protein